MQELINTVNQVYSGANIETEEELRQFFIESPMNLRGKWYFVVPSKELVLVVNAKTGLKSNVLNLVNLYEDLAVADGMPGPFALINQKMVTHVKLVQELTPEEENYYKYTFVRNPFSRMVSNYEYFLNNDFILPFMCDFSSFEALVDSVSLIPDDMIDRHFRSQYYALGVEDDLVIDFIGKFEKIVEDYNVVKEKFDLKDLQHAHKGEYINSWESYYTPEIAKKVYDRYKLDFETFGYADEYQRLIDLLSAE